MEMSIGKYSCRAIMDDVFSVVRVSAGVPFFMVMFFGIFFLWSPGQTKQEATVAPKHLNLPPSPSAKREVSLPDIISDEAERNESPAERLNKVELELFWLKRERHELQKALENKEYRFPKKRLHADNLRRPCT
jgi:hypothetical protein